MGRTELIGKRQRGNEPQRKSIYFSAGDTMVMSWFLGGSPDGVNHSLRSTIIRRCGPSGAS